MYRTDCITIMPITGGKKVKNEFYKYVAKRMDDCTKELITRLSYVGEKCVNEARNAGSYTDQTGNLRSSTGYAVVLDGRIVRQSSFEKVKATATEGATVGGELVRRLAASYSDGLVLIVVAGMNYAVYVEAKGYNVLDSAEMLAKTLVPDMLRNMGL